MKLSEIKIGKRIRDDYGDIEGLVESIKKYGLLHPIVVDADNNLIAGGRRLEAFKLLGREEIPARRIGELTDKERRVLELEENIMRKDLTEYEKSKDLVELAEIKKEEKLEEKNWTESVHPNSPNKIGTRQISKEIGVPRQTLVDAQKHVEAVEKYPDLINFPKSKAIEVYKKLGRNLDDTEYQKEIQKINNQWKIQKFYTKTIFDCTQLEGTDEDLEAWFSDMDTKQIEREKEKLNRAIGVLQNLKTTVTQKNKMERFKVLK